MCRSVVVSALTVFQIALLGDADCKDALCSFEKLSVLRGAVQKVVSLLPGWLSWLILPCS